MYIPSYVLVIIDMQPVFLASHNGDVQANIIKTIHQAKKDQAGIFVIEYNRDLNDDPKRKTHKTLTDEIGEYNLSHIVYKYEDDGSCEILNQIVYLGWCDNMPNFKIVGVNYGACVLKTILGLIEQGLLPEKIEVLSQCCNQPSHWGEEYYEDSWDGITEYLEEEGVLII